jgi:hypothetical protein
MAEYCKYCKKLLSGDPYDLKDCWGDCGNHFQGKEVARMSFVICSDCKKASKYNSGNGNSMGQYECPHCGGELRHINGNDFKLHELTNEPNSWAALKKEVESKINGRSK